jgi:hypothetical protein
MHDDPDTPIQEIEVPAGEGGGPDGAPQPEFFDRAKERFDRAVEEAKQELTELVEEAKEEFDEIREKAPGWVQDARRKVADFLEPEPEQKEE